jgi:hypothetical protein
MKKIISLLAIVFILPAQWLCGQKVAGIPAGPSAGLAAAQRILGTVELMDVIRPGAESLAPGVYKLSREWVGSLTPVEDKQARTRLRERSKLRPKYPELLRLNCLSVGQDGAIRLVAGRFNEDGYLGGYRHFKLERALRSPDEILRTRELDVLRSWFGNQHDFSGGWSNPDVLNWTEHWMFFSPRQNDVIVCQNIYAYVSRKRKTTGGGTPLEKVVFIENPQVNIMTFSQSVFRPANPDSDKDRRMYPSENDRHLARVVEENVRIDAQPEPLRSLLRARYTPDDYDLLAYKAAVDRFRVKPDPKLVRQLVERLDDGDGEMGWLLEALMDERMGSNPPGFVPWKSENKKTAVEALIDSMPEAPGYHAEKVIVMILADTGLVALKMDDPEFSIDDAALPRTPTSGGYGGSYMNLYIKSGANRKAVLNRIANELRHRWEASGFCVERYSSPNTPNSSPNLKK